MGSRPHIGAGVAIGLGLLLIAAVIGFDTARMQIPPTYARVGPNVFPMVIASGLALCGALAVFQILRPGDQPAIPAPEGDTDWRAVLWILAGLAAQIYLLKLAGFVITAALVFLCVALGFGSRRYARDAICALFVALASYLGFTQGLGLQLPAGILQGIL